MAQVLEETITVTISRLVRNQDQSQQVLTDEQLVALLDTLPSVVEQVLDDSSLIVEANRS